jgi:outer membrane protein TolC
MQSRFLSLSSRWLLVASIFAVRLIGAQGASAAEEEAASEAIKSLLKERLAIATLIYEQRSAAHKQGATTFEQVARAQANLLAAKLDLCTTKVERLAVHEEMVKLAAQSVSIMEELAKANEVPQFDLLSAKLELVTARLALERAKAAQ